MNNREFDKFKKRGTTNVNPMVVLFLGFTIGFLACHKLYKGLDDGKSISQISNIR